MAELKSIYPVIDRVREGAHLDSLASYQAMWDQSVTDNDGFWSEHARNELVWTKDFTEVNGSDYHAGKISWFADGELNVCYNCVDRHLPARADQTALLWEGDEPGDVRRITYRELHQEVCKFANVLKAHGANKGDRIAIYMLMIPEAVFADAGLCPYRCGPFGRFRGILRRSPS